jgi:hypothetical protein
MDGREHNMTVDMVENDVVGRYVIGCDEQEVATVFWEHVA